MHRIAALALWLSMAFGVALAVEVYVAVDEAQPAGTETAFNVVSVATATKAEAVAVVAEAARAAGRDVYKVQPDPRDSFEGRILFAFAADPAVFQAADRAEYPTFFGRTPSTVVRAADEITTEDLRGRYVTTATGEELTAMLSSLQEQGLEVRDASVPLLALVAYGVSQGNLTGCLVVMMLALALALAHATAANRKVYALRQIHGYRRIADIRAEVGHATVAFGVGLALLVAAGVPLMAVGGGLRQWAGFARLLGVTLALLYVAVVLAVVVAVLCVPRRSVPVVLKGERPSVRDGVLAAVAQVAVLAIVVATTSAALARADSVRSTLDEFERWTDGEPLYALRLSTTGTHEDDMRTAPALAEVVADLERAGEVLLVGYKGGIDEDTAPHSVAPEGAHSLIVNGTYLEREVVRAADGQRVVDVPGGENRFTLLVPTSYTGDPAALLDEYVGYFADFACASGTPGGARTCDPVGDVVRTQAGQTLFAYNGTAFLPAQMQERASVDDPVLVVVQADSGLLSPMEYLSYVSRDDVLFSDADALRARLTSAGVLGAFQGVDNAADSVTTSVALAQRQLRSDAVSLVLGGAVLLLSSLVMVAVYCDRRRRPMFVELVHGYGFVRRHRAYLAAALGLSVVGVVAAGVVGGALAHGRDVAVAAGIVAVQAAVSLVSVRVYETRFRADFIKRY